MLLNHEASILVMLTEDAFDDIGDVNNKIPKLSTLITDIWTIDAYIQSKNDLIGEVDAQSVFYGFIAHREQEYIIVIRGTSKFVEWIIDVNAIPEDSHKFKGKVSSGFYSVYKNMNLIATDGIEYEILTGIEAIVKQNNVTLVGHSLGSAIGTYLSLDLCLEKNIFVYPILFASPKPGDRIFVNYYDSVVKNYSVYNYIEDIVPNFPPSKIGYASLPKLTMITHNTAKVKMKPQWNPLTSMMCNHHSITYAKLLGSNVDVKLLNFEEQEYCRVCLD